MEDTDPITLFGVHDHNIRILDNNFPETKINARGERVKITGPAEEVALVREVIQGMIEVVKRKNKVSEDDIKTLIALKSGEFRAKERNHPAYTGDGDLILYTHKGEAILAKTPGQKRIAKSSAANDIVFAIGPAGTGKTYTSVALAVKALKERKVQKIILARPAVEAGENLGFLPGDLKEKIDPYLRPLYDALEDMIDQDKLNLHLSKNVIEIAPLAYMRGRTLNNAFVILDEAQNATNTQMKMFLTRIGFNSRAIITGDVTQTDLPRRQQSGLISIQKILKDVEGIEFVYLKDEDVVRHKLVKDIINAYDRFDSEESDKEAK
ncbi:MAG: PhoH family protein [Balneolaceae bacterium]|nr:PhoH family protein [Balneolaceae bacterium]MBO6546991.1 PhoH family protein [Balneolaceae bacterium]MBO6649351.1 PhoH family protein [Balneolaceae bacterium]